MKRNMTSIFLAVTLLLSILCGCSAAQPIMSISQNVEKAPDTEGISGMRTGILRQGIAGQFKSYECTDERVYFLLNLESGSWLYYGTHTSDQLLPLCTLETCEHDAPGCEAYFSSNGNICYEDGYLYVSDYAVLYRLNPDGSGRVKVIDVLDAVEGYNGIAEPALWNGVFTFYLTEFRSEKVCTSDGMFLGWKDAQTKYDPFYYKLDGSMEKPAPMENLVAMFNDGDTFLMRNLPQDNGSVSEYLLYAWDPNKNTAVLQADGTEVVQRAYRTEEETLIPESDDPEIDMLMQYIYSPNPRFYEGYDDAYWGADFAYYLQPTLRTDIPPQRVENVVSNNLICKLNYSDGSTEVLLDTGLRGTYRMSCFPDCIVLSEVTNDSTVPSGTTNDMPRLYFFNWDFELLGEYGFEEKIGVNVRDLICGESAGRIYIAMHLPGAPAYYIEKSDFGTGHIELHKFKYPDLDEKTYRQLFGED